MARDSNSADLERLLAERGGQLMAAAIRQAVIPAGFRMLPSTDLPLPASGQGP
jgi:hypothetical protein